MTDIERLQCQDVAEPKGHYVHAITWRELLFVSGQLPIARCGVHQVCEPFEIQARSALANVLAVLAGAGADWTDVLRLTAYVVDVEKHWSTFDALCAAMLGSAKPARTVVPVPQLHHGYLVEIDAIAVKRSTKASEDRKAE